MGSAVIRDDRYDPAQLRHLNPMEAQRAKEDLVILGATAIVPGFAEASVMRRAALGSTGTSTRLAAGERYKQIISSVDGKVIGEYDALNPGALPDGRASTFSGGRYAEMTVNQSTTVYRAWSPRTWAAEDGTYWSLEQPKGALQTKIDSALLPEWGGGRPPFNPNIRSQANNWTAIELPQGTTIYLGEVGGQKGTWVGGGSQLLIKGGPNLNWKVGGGTLQ